MNARDLIPHIGRNFGWHRLRLDTGRFASPADCAEHCVPGIRACAHLFSSSREAGDALVEAFLSELFDEAISAPPPRTPEEMTAAFEAYLRARFGDMPRRIVLSTGPERVDNVWMSVDEFFHALTH